MDKIEQKFIGVWELDEWIVEKPNGDKTFPFSGNVDGFLIYHSEGWMSATLMQKNRTDVSNDKKNYIKISFAKKNLAKSYGAKWDPITKSWYYLDNLDSEKITKLKELQN